MDAKRSFALKLIPLFAVSGFLMSRHHPTLAWAWAAFGLGVIVAGLLLPRLLNPLHRLFSHWGRALRSAMTRVVLELVYTLVLTPIAWLARRVGKSFLDLEIQAARDSYFIRRSKDETKVEDFEKGY